jgi:hypothetical protein
MAGRIPTSVTASPSQFSPWDSASDLGAAHRNVEQRDRPKCPSTTTALIASEIASHVLVSAESEQNPSSVESER